MFSALLKKVSFKHKSRCNLLFNIGSKKNNRRIENLYNELGSFEKDKKIYNSSIQTKEL